MPLNPQGYRSRHKELLTEVHGTASDPSAVSL